MRERERATETTTKKYKLLQERDNFPVRHKNFDRLHTCCLRPPRSHSCATDPTSTYILIQFPCNIAHVGGDGGVVLEQSAFSAKITLLHYCFSKDLLPTHSLTLTFFVPTIALVFCLACITMLLLLLASSPFCYSLSLDFSRPFLFVFMHKTTKKSMSFCFVQSCLPTKFPFLYAIFFFLSTKTLPPLVAPTVAWPDSGLCMFPYFGIENATLAFSVVYGFASVAAHPIEYPVSTCLS